MVRILFLFMFAVFVAAGCSGGSEPVSGENANGTESVPLEESEIVELTMHSSALDKEMKLNVYLPKGYSDAVEYPVLYMIHGFGGNETNWFGPGLRLHEQADQLIEEGTIEPLIIVSPEVNNSYGLNSAQKYSKLPPDLDVGRYEDYLVQDVVGYIDSTYSTRADREHRYIGGLSMGGFISLHTAFLYPDMFSKVGGHSPALFLDDWSKVGGLNNFLYPSDGIRTKRDPIRLAETAELTDMQIYLDCGDMDYFEFYKGAQMLHDTLTAKGLQSQYHANTGAHDDAYWSAHAAEYLQFYAGK